MRSSMRSRSGRASLVLAVVLAVGAAAALPAAAVPSSRHPAGPGSTVTFSGNGNEFITAGREWSFDTTTAQMWATVWDEDGRELRIQVRGTSLWSLELAAPPGERLTAGVTYENAARSPFQDEAPGLSLSGDGRGCNRLTGSFTVLAADFNPDGSVEEFEATFEQRCTPGVEDEVATGHVRIGDVVAPAPLTVDTEVTSGTFSRGSGSAVLTGTLTCSRDAEVDLAGALAQRVSRTRLATGAWSLGDVVCGPAPTTWTAIVAPEGRVPFGTGVAQVDLTAEALDNVTGEVVTTVVDAEVRLTS